LDDVTNEDLADVVDPEEYTRLDPVTDLVLGAGAADV